MRTNRGAVLHGGVAHRGVLDKRGYAQGEALCVPGATGVVAGPESGAVRHIAARYGEQQCSPLSLPTPQIRTSQTHARRAVWITRAPPPLLPPTAPLHPTVTLHPTARLQSVALYFPPPFSSRCVRARGPPRVLRPCDGARAEMRPESSDGRHLDERCPPPWRASVRRCGRASSDGCALLHQARIRARRAQARLPKRNTLHPEVAAVLAAATIGAKMRSIFSLSLLRAGKSVIWNNPGNGEHGLPSP
ncbi:hypothetical protein HYPSUDRAFT_207651 [Hypholoma sublateritium FD-334 SS-4]|uniref:Uncharacterized protein n=1 Tax=Hypholoma sublateritium (strain FD-334 SS-4) TaxID=945553 RepID=A0A0D2KMC5_HYPSF|nr:hypothetical protein HYPSUDRAFT_207651 [Hypholoma sublateritium FD-334 SS-4]